MSRIRVSLQDNAIQENTIKVYFPGKTEKLTFNGKTTNMG